MPEQTGILHGERVVIVAYADGPELCGTPWDKGRSAHPVRGNPKPGEKMVLVRLEDGETREWWPSRSVRGLHEDGVVTAMQDYLKRKAR